MAKALSQKLISLKEGTAALHAFLTLYKARYYETSSTEKGHVYWTEADGGKWILVMKKGNNARVTFHAADDCPCKLI